MFALWISHARVFAVLHNTSQIRDIGFRGFVRSPLTAVIFKKPSNFLTIISLCNCEFSVNHRFSSCISADYVPIILVFFLHTQSLMHIHIYTFFSSVLIVSILPHGTINLTDKACTWMTCRCVAARPSCFEMYHWRIWFDAFYVQQQIVICYDASSFTIASYFLKILNSSILCTHVS